MTSATSGKTYVVVPLGGDRADCTCAFGRNARIADPTRVCSHVLAVRAWVSRLIRTVDPNTGLTSCCGARSTYHDETECCKACWHEVVSTDVPVKIKLGGKR